LLERLVGFQHPRVGQVDVSNETFPGGVQRY
jgi:hypothetical protein